jgi:hypothetical protein
LRIPFSDKYLKNWYLLPMQRFDRAAFQEASCIQAACLCGELAGISVTKIVRQHAISCARERARQSHPRFLTNGAIAERVRRFSTRTHEISPMMRRVIERLRSRSR